MNLPDISALGDQPARPEPTQVRIGQDVMPGHGVFLPVHRSFDSGVRGQFLMLDVRLIGNLAPFGSGRQVFALMAILADGYVYGSFHGNATDRDAALMHTIEHATPSPKPGITLYVPMHMIESVEFPEQPVIPEDSPLRSMLLGGSGA